MAVFSYRSSKLLASTTKGHAKYVQMYLEERVFQLSDVYLHGKFSFVIVEVMFLESKRLSHSFLFCTIIRQNLEFKVHIVLIIKSLHETKNIMLTEAGKMRRLLCFKLHQVIRGYCEIR